MTSLFFLSGKRTPFGSYGGALKDQTPTQLGVVAGRAALESSGVLPDQVDHVIFGNVIHSAHDSIYTPRHVGLHLGIPENVPALAVNRLCGSGFQSVVEASLQMHAGDTEVALVGGLESMSLTPYALRGARFGMRMGNGEVIDLMTESLTDVYAKAPMAITAENLAEKYGISREACDLFALQSQTRAKLAAQGGFFRDEIVPWILKSPKGDQTLALDQHMRPETTIEALQKLKPLFKKDGTVTAGTASGIVDGGAAMVVASERRVKAEKWNPIGRLVSYGIVGCDPKLMGIGPVPAIKVALKRAGMTLDQMDAIEVNEAFAAQTLAVAKELELSTDRLNAWGGAISLGHPLAASGTRILMTLLHQLRRSKKRYGLGSACIGGGQGIAIVVEAFH